MTNDIDLLLRKNLEHLTELHEVVWPSLTTTDDISDDGVYLVKQVVENSLSALDWMATAIDRKFGKASDRSPYYPLRTEPEDFENQFTRDFPGVREKAPDVHKVFAFHQPYTKGKAELAHVHELARVNKHRHFTRQVREQYPYMGFSFGGMSLINQGGPDGGFRIGGGGPQYGHFIEGGVSTSEDGSMQFAQGTLVEWYFVEPSLPVQTTIAKIHNLVSYACTDIVAAGDL